MATGATSGAAAILARVTEILTDHLASEVATIATDLGGITIATPDTTHGLSDSRYLPRDHTTAVRVLIDGVSQIDEFRVIGAPKRQEVTCRVSIHHGHPDPYRVEENLLALAAATERVVEQYIRADDATHKPNVYDLEAAQTIRGSSIRERYASRGLTTLGRGLEDTVEQLDVVFTMRQHVAAPVAFSDP